MECNKEEGERAKELAEEKMNAGDFVGAQKFVNKAQRLFPDLDNIQKMIAICDVHTSADKKLCGLENWFAILQVQEFAKADEIKKQYRRLVLLLHPDKNKFAGAEAAFKLVGEANRVLTEPGKRNQYDVRYRSHSALARSRNANANSNRHSTAAANNPQQQSLASVYTFWTCCNHCGQRYKYLRDRINSTMVCSNCQKSYIACDVDGLQQRVSVKDNQANKNASTKEESGNSSAQRVKKRAVRGKLSKNQGKQKSDAEEGNPIKVETSAGIPKADDVSKPQPEVKKPETSEQKSVPDSSVSEQKRGSGCTEEGNTLKADDDVSKPQPGVKEPETREQKSMPDLSAPKNNQRAKRKRKTVEEPAKIFEFDASDAKADVTKGSSLKDFQENQNASTKAESGNSAADSVKKVTVRGKQKRGPKNDAEKGKPLKGETGDEIPKADVSKPQPEVKEPETTRTSTEKSMPDLSAPMKNQAAKRKRTAVEEPSKIFEFDASDAKTDTNGFNKRKSPRSKPQVSYAIPPIKRTKSDCNTKQTAKNNNKPPATKTKSGCDTDSDSNVKQTAESNKSDSGVSAASSRASKGKEKKDASSGNEDVLSAAKNKESEGCSGNGEAMLDVPDSDLNVFEFARKKEHFAVNQVWSIRDSLDDMPRRYARVKKVLSNDEFKLRVTYLDPIQDTNEKGIIIPFACGKFKNGKTEEIEDQSVFSGQMHTLVYDKFVSICPRKGEVWALFRNWKKEWDYKPPYEYDFVEILSDYEYDVAIGVAYLGKLKGFDNRFHRRVQHGYETVQFYPSEVRRFSHKVPAVEITEGVSAVSFELDSAALPKGMEIDTETVAGPCPEAPKVEVKDKPVPETKRKKPDDDNSGAVKCRTTRSHSQVEEKHSGAAAADVLKLRKPPCPEAPKVEVTVKPVPETVVPSLRKRRKPDDDNSVEVKGRITRGHSQVEEKQAAAAEALKLRKSPRLQPVLSQQREKRISGKADNKRNNQKKGIRA